jgi:zinc protease
VADPGDLALFRKMMDEVTLDEVNAAVHKWIQADNLQIAIVTEHADKLAEAIASDAPSPIDYQGSEKPAALLAEDKIIQSWPLKVSREAIEVVPVEQMFEK